MLRFKLDNAPSPHAIGVRSNFYIENKPPGIDFTQSDIQWNSFLPSHVRELELGSGLAHYNGKMIVALPSFAQFTRLQTIKFVQFAQWNAPTRENESLWPESLRRLEYVSSDSTTVKASKILFPPALIHLRLPEDEDEFVESPFSDLNKIAFPVTLKELMLPSKLKKAIDDWIPPTLSGLTSLTCDVHPKQDLASVKWPTNLHKLEINSSTAWLKPIKSLSSIVLPESLHTLVLLILTHPNPDSLNEVVFPASLRRLNLGWSYPHSISEMMLPNALTHLEANVKSLRPYSSSLTRFTQLKHLTLNGGKTDPEMSSQLHMPISLSVLEIDTHLNQPLAGIHLPARLSALLIHSRVFNHSLSGTTFPPSLRRIEIGQRSGGRAGSKFNHPLDLSATQVEVLDLGDAWNLPLTQLQLPPTLRELHFGQAFNQPFAVFPLPPHLEVLTIGSSLHNPPQFRYVQSLMQLKLPHTIRKLTLPHPNLLPTKYSDKVQRVYSAFIASFTKGPIQVDLVE